MEETSFSTPICKLTTGEFSEQASSCCKMAALEQSDLKRFFRSWARKLCHFYATAMGGNTFNIAMNGHHLLTFGRTYCTVCTREYELMTEAYAKLSVVRNCSRSYLCVCRGGEGKQLAGGGWSAVVGGGGGRQYTYLEQFSTTESWAWASVYNSYSLVCTVSRPFQSWARILKHFEMQFSWKCRYRVSVYFYDIFKDKTLTVIIRFRPLFRSVKIDIKPFLSHLTNTEACTNPVALSDLWKDSSLRKANFSRQ